MTTPADPRALAQEAIELAGKATPDLCKCGHAWGAHVRQGMTDPYICDESDSCLCLSPREHVRVEYELPLARALIEALDCAQKSADIMQRTRDRAAAVTADRDSLLADLPHALGRCGCAQTFVMRSRPGDRYERPVYEWLEAHTAAIERLEERIK